MSYFYSDPLEVQGNVHFRLSDLDGHVFHFVVTKQALEDACGLPARRSSDHDPISAFRKLEENIHSLAEKMIDTGIRQDPIVISNPLFI